MIIRKVVEQNMDLFRRNAILRQRNKLLFPPSMEISLDHVLLNFDSFNVVMFPNAGWDERNVLMSGAAFEPSVHGNISRSFYVGYANY